MQDVGAVDDIERFAHVVVGDQHADATVLEMRHQIADVGHGDRVDARQRLVEQHETRLRGQRPGDLDPPPLAARKGQRRGAPQVGNREFGQQVVERGLALLADRFDHLEHGADVVLHRKAAKDRGLLGQIADAHAGAAVHRQVGEIVAIEGDGPVVGRDQTGNQVEACRLAGAVGSEESDRFTAPHGQADAAQDGTLAVLLAEVLGNQA